jgi:NitT/TauT family transport system permease protein
MAKEKYRHHIHQNFLNSKRFHERVLFYIIGIAAVVVLAFVLFGTFNNPNPIIHSITTVFQRISFGRLLLYGLFTFSRLVVSFIVALAITGVALLFIVGSRRLENFLLPIFDVLQSVPVLAFFPLIIVVFARLHLPELAAQIVLFVAMLWSVLFAAIGGMHQIPQDILDASRIYGGTGFKKFTKVIVPAIFPNLVTGSQLSFGAGWNVIIISEYINYGTVQIHLPGLGSLLSTSAATDPGIFVAALVLMILIIAVLNRSVWHRLVNYSEKFKFED